MTAFIITKDKIDSDAVGTIGPRSASERDEARLRAGEGVAFRLLDDDREIYYYGRRLEESDADETYDGEPELAPLDCFGTPNAGAVIQEEKDADGKWAAIN
ncbi:hypothetical protein SEA_TUCK_52 [Arthrobacter phage Tuck]|uniref:Uncharacterized protein n=2 Tax=Yangvirus TaxID=2733221 RepID=A0A9E8M9I5_9CAUD|nr:hypothetical protein PQD82_gp52 [Arthrobacter phage Phives]QOP65180.1 hypothetical protein SEA_PHIVES_53 [Arthrobacter phage Phives]WAB10826.1 hypothetical protein SEA_TUCK_52 [Arthrobacter phage Tuck]